MPSAFRSIGASDYEREVITHPGGVVVFFWAPRSDACRFFIAPLEQYVAARSGNPKLVKVNVEEHREAAKAARIGALPALLAYREGRVVAELIGTGGPHDVERVLASAAG